MTPLSADQKDAIGEIFTVAINRSASVLSAMIGEEVVLTVPDVHFVPLSEAAVQLAEKSEANCCAVRQNFGGPISGQSWLVFPAAKSLELVRSVLDEFDALHDMTELDQDAVSEVGNVVLNRCLSTLANELGLKFDVSLPELFNGNTRNALLPNPPHDEEIQPWPQDGDDQFTILIDVRFDIDVRDITGPIMIIVHIGSVGGHLTGAFTK